MCLYRKLTDKKEKDFEGLFSVSQSLMWLFLHCNISNRESQFLFTSVSNSGANL